MPRQKSQVPAYLLHQATGQARVRIRGRDIYLGPYGSDESRRRYGEVIAGSPAAVSRDPMRPTPAPDDPGPSVAVICLAFWRHAQRHYLKRGKPTSELAAYDSVISILSDLFGSLPAVQFGPSCLKTCRSRMIELGWVRTSANRGAGRIRHIFRHAVEEELIPPTTWEALKAVSPLLAGRTEAPEADPVRPVSDATIEATLPHLPDIVADMVRVQRLTGMRPGEVTRMLWEEIDTSGSVWLYRPGDHKLVHHNIDRVIAIGPAAQVILLRRRMLVGPVFPGDDGAYTTAAYRRAITRGCEVAFGMPEHLRLLHAPPPMRRPTRAKRQAVEIDQKPELRRRAAKWRREHCWSPNQLRHQFATELRKTAGLDAVAAALGHSQLTTTQVYAELGIEKAVAVAAQIG